METKIYNYLKKYYLHNSNKFKKLLKYTAHDDIVNIFNKLWGKEHGGLFRIDKPFNPPEILPYIKNNRIIITDTGSNSITFHKKYINRLNKLLLSSKELNLDFQNNYGGKPQVMIAGLLPLFKNNGVLSYYYDKNNKRHNDIIMKNNNIIISKSNNNAFSIGTSKKIKKIEMINAMLTNMA
jgi:hypothetical protein